MAALPPSKETVTKNSNTLVTTKKARLISKDLDRSSAPNRKPRGKFQQQFKRNTPNNYAANVATTHGLSLALPAEKLALLGDLPGLTNKGHNRLPAICNGAVLEQTPSILQRALIQQGLPSKTADASPDRKQSVKLSSMYQPARRLLAVASRVRAHYEIAWADTKTSRVPQ